MSTPQVAAETRGRSCELAFERPVEKGFGLMLTSDAIFAID
jgi:hypothetical protein